MMPRVVISSLAMSAFCRTPCTSPSRSSPDSSSDRRAASSAAGSMSSWKLAISNS